MADRNNAATTSENDLAEGLPNEDFFFEGEDGQLVGQGNDDDGGEVTVEDAADGTTETQEEPGEQSEEGTVGEETAAKQPVVAPAAKAAVAPPAPTPAATTPQAPASDATPPRREPTFHESVRANFPAVLDHVVAQGAFRLSPEEAEIVDPAAAPVIERYGARVFLQTMTAVSQLFHDTLPGVVNSLMGIRDSGASQEDKFFNEYGLDKTKSGEITQIAYTLRQLKPDLNGKAYADEVARVSHAMLGTQPPAKKPAANGLGKPAATGQQPGAKVIARKAFTPAAKAGGAGQPQNRRPAGAPPPEKNPLFDLSAMLNSSVELDD